MIRRLTAVLVSAAFAAPAVAADVLSNSYVDAAYLNSDIESDTASEKVEGFRLAANIGLAKFLNFTGDYEQRRFPDGRLGTGSAGLAWHTQDPVWQVSLGATYERIETDVNDNPAQDAIEEGYGAQAGFRWAFPHGEFHAAYRYMDFGQIDRTETDFTAQRYGAGFDVQLSPWWSLVADYRIREHETKAPGASAETVEFAEYTVGFRRYFATDTDRRVRRGGVIAAWFGGDESAE